MSHTAQAAQDGTANMVPTKEEMLEMLNVDVLPYFDSYDMDTFSFGEKYRAIEVLRVNDESFSFTLNTGAEIEVSKEYFKFPGAQKAIAISRLEKVLN